MEGGWSEGSDAVRRGVMEDGVRGDGGSDGEVSNACRHKGPTCWCVSSLVSTPLSASV